MRAGHSEVALRCVRKGVKHEAVPLDLQAGPGKLMRGAADPFLVALSVIAQGYI